MITESQLRALMQNEEGQHLEFKQSLRDWKEIGEYAVGIGNEGGGWLLMGITNSKPRRIVGIRTPTTDELQQIKRSVWDSMNIRIETHVVTTSDGTVLAVKIPSRLPGQLFQTRDGKFLMRVGEDLRGMSQVEIAAVLAETAPAKPSISAELKALPKGQRMLVTPQLPRDSATRPLTLVDVNDRTVTVRTSGDQMILIPVSAVATTQWQGNVLTLRVTGRLQWLTGEERWKFFDEPLSESQRDLGIPKPAVLQNDPRVRAVEDRLSPKEPLIKFSTFHSQSR
jgi:Putative DNA-binding domain